MTVWESNDSVSEKESQYGVILLEANCKEELARNKKLPRNSYIVSYMENGVVHYDIVIGLMTNIFDCYYDSLGKGSLQTIKYTDGTVSSKLFNKKRYLGSSRGVVEEKK